MSSIAWSPCLGLPPRATAEDYCRGLLEANKVSFPDSICSCEAGISSVLLGCCPAYLMLPHTFGEYTFGSGWTLEAKRGWGSYTCRLEYRSAVL